jgi:hypothetical protein
MDPNLNLTEPTFPLIIDEPFDCAWDFGVAAQHIVLSHFRRMLGWRKVVLANEELEGVHQIRVEARRARTALQTFAMLWDKAEVKAFGDYLADFATAFGTARDLDVLCLYLEQQLDAAEGPRAAAHAMLLEQSRAKRLKLQPKLEREILRLERSGLPAAFTAYFSSKPFDLWGIGGESGHSPDPVGAGVGNG